MKKILILFSLLFIGCSNNAYKEISYQEVFKEIGDTVILDVRSYNEYKNGHIESSTNLPVEEIEKIKYDKDTKIIVYCNSGNRSKQASDKLIKMGYNNIYDMGGINNWPYDIVEE